MFIKIKLEPQKVLPLLKNISYFSIDDDATIFNLKTKIEEYAGVRAELQEIRTLIGISENNYHVKEVCDTRGSAIMLYAYDECDDLADPQFVCFLQVYTNELAVQQQELEQRLKFSMENTTETTPTSSTSSVTLIADSDTDRDSVESDTEPARSSDSGSNTDNSNDSSCKKRRKLERKCSLKNKKLKVIASSESQYSDTLCQYLDEFPNCHKKINSKNYEMPTYKTQGLDESPNKKTTSNDVVANGYKSSDVEKSDENEHKLVKNTNFQKSSETQQTTIANSSKIQLNTIRTTITNHNNNNNNIHPCYFINPEIRDFLAIISPNDVDIINNVECEELLLWFFDRFRESDSSDNLQFDKQAAISLFDGKLWIACMNMNTFEWISANVNKYSLKSYKILALKDSKHVFEVVVPMVSNSINVLNIFDLLEKQNKNLTTLKWSLQSRQPLLAEDKDFNEKAISKFCRNELLKIGMDTESKNYLENFNFNLKYCFWQIVFIII